MPAQAQVNISAPGDLNSDCQVDVADALLLQRHLSGDQPIPGLETSGLADLAPLGGSGAPDPDGESNPADLLVLLRMLRAEVPTPSLIEPPTITPPGSPEATTNPITLSGTTPAGATMVRVYVNGVEGFAPAPVTGTDWTAGGASAVFLQDGENTIQVQTEVAGELSCLSPPVVITYTNPNPRDYDLGATITTDTVWTRGPGPSGTPYTISGGDLTITPGATLTILDGVVVEFVEPDLDRKVVIDGALRVQESEAQSVTFTSSSPVPGAWKGLEVQGDDVLIDRVRIEYADIGIEVVGPNSATITNSRVVDFRLYGIHIHDSFPQGVAHATVANNIIEDGSVASSRGVSIDNNDYTGGTYLIEGNQIRGTSRGVYVDQASPEIRGNTIEDNGHGITMERGSQATAPAVIGNTITGNTTGITIFATASGGGPIPMIAWNRIHGNSTLNFDADTSWPISWSAQVGIRAEFNYWGTETPSEIEDTIQHRADDLGAGSDFGGVTVDYLPYLDAAGNPQEAPNQLSGILETDRILDVGEYELIGALTVLPGVTLTIPAGVTLRAHDGDTRLAVNGQLLVEGEPLVEGQPDNRVLFTTKSGNDPGPDDWGWHGIAVLGPGTSIQGAHIQYASTAIELFKPVDAAIIDSQIESFSDYGIRFVGSNPKLTIERNAIKNAYAERDGTAIANGGTLSGAAAGSVVIADNEIDGVDRGIYLERSSPQITGNTIANTTLAVSVIHGYAPVINGNTFSNNGSPAIDIRLSTTASLSGNMFDAATNRKLDVSAGPDIHAEYNYWGATTTGEIEARIHHQVDVGSLATVITDPFLDENGIPQSAGANVLSGEQHDGTTTINPELVYTVSGAMSVPSGEILTIPAGSQLEFLGGATLVAEGSLIVGGTGDPVVFTSADMDPGPGAWKGIEIQGSGSTIDNAEIWFAKKGVTVQGGASATITNSKILEFSQKGIHLRYSISPLAAADATITGNTITGSGQGIGIHEDNLAVSNPNNTVVIDNNTITGTDDGIHLAFSNAILTGNTVQGNGDGVVISGGHAPQITDNNTITANSRGVVLSDGTSHDTVPVLHGNRIYDNPTTPPHTNFTTGTWWFGDHEGTIIDAEGNFWGEVEPALIEAGIVHLNDTLETATVDYLPFLDGPGGSPVPDAGFLLGPVDDISTPLLPGTTYEALGWLLIPEGTVFTIPAGTEILMHQNAGILAEGQLIVEGDTSPGGTVLLRSALSSPEPGNWQGIRIRSTSVGSSISHAEIRHAEVGLRVTGTDAAIEDSVIAEFSDTGVSFLDVAGGVLLNNTIDGGGSGTGVFLRDASPAISGNGIANNQYGMRAFGDSHPVVDGGNSFDFNDVAIYLEGENGLEPTPIIQGNQISIVLSNSVAIQLAGYSSGTTPAIDATGNWWGTDNPDLIRGTIESGNTVPAVIDFSGFLDAPDGDPADGSSGQLSALLTGVSLESRTFSPVAGETAEIQFQLHSPAQVTLRIYPEDDDDYGNLLYEATESRATGVQTISWNGYRTGGLLRVPDEAYAYVLSAGNGAFTHTYDPPRSAAPMVHGGYGTVPETFDTLGNDYWKMTLEIWEEQFNNPGGPGRITLRVTPSGGTTFDYFTDRPFDIGDHPILFDGRDATGALIDGSVAFHYTVPTSLKLNSVIVAGSDPVLGAPEAPGVEIRADPYLVYHSFEQFSRIAYRLDRNCYVTVSILRPNKVDPNEPGALLARIFDNQFQSAEDGVGSPIDHLAEWRGYEPEDSNQILADEEGPYTFLIQARDASQPDLETVYRGVLNLRR